jgi:hypothetical protein
VAPPHGFNNLVAFGAAFGLICSCFRRLQHHSLAPGQAVQIFRYYRHPPGCPVQLNMCRRAIELSRQRFGVEGTALIKPVCRLGEMSFVSGGADNLRFHDVQLFGIPAHVNNFVLQSGG